MEFNSKKGFTLIELLVVIAIIGILSSVVLASLNSAREKSRDARRVGDIKQLQLALELYFDSNQSYPDVLTDLSPPTSNFIAVDPKDPVGGAFYFYNSYTTDARPPVLVDNCDNVEELADKCIFYHLGANLEGGEGHAALTGDADLAGNIVDGDDADACDGAAARYCFDIVP